MKTDDVELEIAVKGKTLAEQVRHVNKALPAMALKEGFDLLEYNGDKAHDKTPRSKFMGFSVNKKGKSVAKYLVYRITGSGIYVRAD